MGEVDTAGVTWSGRLLFALAVLVEDDELAAADSLSLCFIFAGYSVSKTAITECK